MVAMGVWEIQAASLVAVVAPVIMAAVVAVRVMTKHSISIRLQVAAVVALIMFAPLVSQQGSLIPHIQIPAMAMLHWKCIPRWQLLQVLYYVRVLHQLL